MNVSKQIQIFQNGKTLKYDDRNLEDRYGFLTNHPLEMKDFEGNQISKTEFSEVYGFETFLSNDYKSALRHFVYYYTNGTLQYVIGDNDLLKDIDYREELKNEASLVEQVFAIFSNNIKMDEDGKVLNLQHSMKRAAQWIRLVYKEKNDTYEVNQQFEDWETELH